MGKIEKLVEIWQEIPKVVSIQLDLSQKDIIKRYTDVFHIGEYFYVIFDTRTAKMDFVSPGSEKMLGYLPEEFSLDTIIENIHPEDLPYFFHYEQSAVEFFSQLQPEHFFNYKFSYDFRIGTKNMEVKRILQQIVPLFYFPQGGARTLGIFTDITHLGVQGIPKLSFIGMNGAPSYYNYHLNREFKKTRQIFTKREKEILSEVIQGMSSKQIAGKLNLSPYTIQTHRKNILKKSGCSNLNELISKSIREGWVWV